jgi:putative NADH-flavin reductase
MARQITILGATGKTGSFVLDQALERGWKITALTRSPEKLSRYKGRVRLISGTNDDVGAICAAIRGADAVISAMGAGGNTLSAFAPIIVSALRQERVSRFVSLIGASIYLPGDFRTPTMALLRSITRILAADVVSDGDRYAKAIAISGLDYTLVRPPRLTMGPASTSVTSGNTLNLGPLSSISRADVAEFMVQAVSDSLFVRAAPMISA